MPTKVLFLCPHAAGKSVAAATYFRAAAARLGVDATASVAGTDPDAEVIPAVRTTLEAQGFDVVDAPRRVSVDDTDAADLIISIGCDRSELAADDVTEWDVPLISEDLAGSLDAIRHHVEELARRLAAGSSGDRPTGG